MTTLRRLQRELQAYLLGAPNAAARYVADAEKLGARARLQIYADAYRLRLSDALASDFPALRAWLGAGRFAEATGRYIAIYPSAHYSLRWFGQHLPRFLAETSPYAEAPLLAELAAFEWALGAAFDAPDAPVLTRAQLAAVPPAEWPRLCLQLHPSVARIDLYWNAPAVWQAVDARAPALPKPVKSAAAIAWIVWRQDLKAYFRSLSADEAHAFEALRADETFARICEALCRSVAADRAAPRAAGLLDGWVAGGLLSGYSQAP